MRGGLQCVHNSSGILRLSERMQSLRVREHRSEQVTRMLNAESNRNPTYDKSRRNKVGGSMATSKLKTEPAENGPQKTTPEK